MRNYSSHIDSPLIKRGRKLGIIFADFSLCLILSLLLFFACDAINTSIGGFDGVGKKLLQEETAMRAFIKDSHLDKENSSKNLVGADTNAKTYVLTLTYASLLKGGIPEENLSKSTYSGYKPVTEDEDCCYFYYASFKVEHQALFSPSDKSLSTYLASLKEGHPFFVDEGYPYLNLDVASKIDESYRNPGFVEGRDIREELISTYKTLLLDAIKDFESTYQPYIASKNAYEQAYRDLLGIKIAEAFIGYLVSTLILYLLVPLFAKDGRTIGNLFFKSAYRSVSGKEPAFWQITMRFLILLLEFAETPPLALLLVYGGEGVHLLSLPLFGMFPCFSLLIHSSLVLLLSYLLSFFPRGRKQTLAEMGSGLIHIGGRKGYEG